MTAELDDTADPGLRQRARRVIPGGMYGHNIDKFLWPGAPQFWTAGQGARVWDADGREYVDLMCSWGPIIHGHRHPKVEEAAARQREQIDTGNGPAPVFVELAELLVQLVDHADWAVFAKNGGDVTTLSLTVARAATGRHTVLVAEGAYHGSSPWFSARDAGVTPGDRAHFRRFTYNDETSLAIAAARADGDVAAILLTPHRHDAGADQESVKPSFARAARALADRLGAVLVLDEVRTGFRTGVGSSWQGLGVHPDLSCWSKAIGNGYPIASLLGRESLRDAASRVLIGGTFWTSAVPMAAAVASLELLRDGSSLEAMRSSGDQIVKGIKEQATTHGHAVRLTGPSTMPYLAFEDDLGFGLAKRWSASVAEGGVYVNPSHNWFMSTALSPLDIARVLEATDRAFGRLDLKGPV